MAPGPVDGRWHGVANRGVAVTHLPEGTVSMLFTDIEGSTAVLRDLGPRYAEVLSLQRSIVRAAVGRHDGHEMGTEGDSFFVTFASAVDAVAAAREAQRELTAATWPGGAHVRVRMGLHTGEPVRHEDGYVGLDVHRAARVCGAAHGGQVLLTEATWQLVRGDDGARAADVGAHRLKDLPQSERLFQLLDDDLPANFPPPRSLGSGSNVPVPRTSLVGREEELADLTRLVTGPGAVVTLTGPAGVGKSRLAMAVAAGLESAFPDGVYFVALAAVRTGKVMWTTVAETVGLAGAELTPEMLLAHLAPRRVLLVLDNLEQIPDAAEVVRALADAGPRVLATSRRALHLVGEHEHPLDPLAVPGPGEPVAGSPAVTLFAERARLVRPGFAVGPDNAEDVAAICRRLDGLPLAIELVAARAKLLGPRAMRARLDQSLGIAASEAGRPGRQRTLRDAVAWSYDLLDPARQRALRHLSVFEGEFDLDDVAALLGDQDDPLDTVAALMDVNLVVVAEGPDGEPRVRLLRTIADFGRERLAETGEAADVRRRHAEHFLAIVEREVPRLRGPEYLRARGRIEDRLSNLRGALRWALGAGPDGSPRALGLALRLCEELGWFWYGCGYQAEGRRWLAQAVQVASDVESADLVGALHGLGVLLLEHGEVPAARELLTECLEYWRRTGDDAGVARELNALGVVHRVLGEPDQARELLTEAAAVAERGGDRIRHCSALSNLALVHLDTGRPAEALEIFHRVLQHTLELDDRWGIAVTRVNIAGTHLHERRTDDAAAVLRRHGREIASMGDVDLTAIVVEHAAVVAAQRGRARVAARLVGAAGEMRARADLPLPAPDRAWFAAAVEEVREGHGGWERDRAAGAELDADAAVEEALALVGAPAGSGRVEGEGTDPL